MTYFERPRFMVTLTCTQCKTRTEGIVGEVRSSCACTQRVTAEEYSTHDARRWNRWVDRTRVRP